MARFKDINFFEKLHISSTVFDTVVSWNFNSTGIALMVQSNNVNDVIQYSFNGQDVHGDMVPTYPSEAIIFDNRVANKVWFRRAAAGDSVIVRIEAWRHSA